MLQSAQTTLLIFEVVAKSEPIGVSEIARRMDLSKSTVQRCLQALADAGWIKPSEQSRQTRWMITAKAYTLGQRVTEQGYLCEVAMPVMEKLWNEVKESVILSIQEGDKSVLIEQYESPAPVMVQIPRGSWAPLHLVPSGKVMLAHADHKIVDQYLARDLAPMTSKTITDPKVLRKELAKIRKQGWAVSIDELIMGASGVASPIFCWKDHHVAALAIVLPTARFPESVRTKYIKLLVAATAEISNQLTKT
jgi:IclR family acetate operon transcriptional repressor